MSTITIEVPSLEQLLEEHPHAICTPMLGTSRVLPPKACPVQTSLEWTWKTTERPVEMDGAHVRIGARAGSYPLTGGRVRFAPGDNITLYARLVDLKGLT